MFDGRAEEAINFYISVIPDSSIGEVTKYKANEGGVEGSVKHATFSLGIQQFACLDTPVKPAFGFTAASSIYITCSYEAEVEKLFRKLSEGGSVMIPLGSYPFCRKYAWFSDRFGVSWQVGFNG